MTLVWVWTRDLPGRDGRQGDVLEGDVPVSCSFDQPLHPRLALRPLHDSPNAGRLPAPGASRLRRRVSGRRSSPAPSPPAALGLMLAVTLTRDVPLNRRPVAIPPDGDERAWAAICCPWERLLLLRAGLDVAAFACLVAALAGRLPSDSPESAAGNRSGDRVVRPARPPGGTARATPALAAPGRSLLPWPYPPPPPTTARLRRGARPAAGCRPSRPSSASCSPGVSGWRVRSRRAAAAPRRGAGRAPAGPRRAAPPSPPGPGPRPAGRWCRGTAPGAPRRGRAGAARARAPRGRGRRRAPRRRRPGPPGPARAGRPPRRPSPARGRGPPAPPPAPRRWPGPPRRAPPARSGAAPPPPPGGCRRARAVRRASSARARARAPSPARKAALAMSSRSRERALTFPLARRRARASSWRSRARACSPRRAATAPAGPGRSPGARVVRRPGEGRAAAARAPAASSRPRRISSQAR